MMAIRELIIKLHKKGFSSIVLTSILSNVVIFIGGIVLVHIVPKEEYGNYTYVQNAFNMLILIGDLGISSATMQLASENYKDTQKLNAYVKYGFKMMIMVSILPVLVVLTSSWWYPHTIAGVETTVRSLFLIPLFQNINLFMLIILRIHLKNNQYAIINILQCVFHYVFTLLFAFIGGWKAAIVAKYPAIIIVTIISAVFVKNMWDKRKCIILDKKEKAEYLKLAFVTQVNAISSTLMNILDVYCVGVFVANSEVIASYKSASVLPTAFNFIPQSVMVFVLPYFGRNCRDIDWVRRNYRKLSIGLIVACGAVAFIGILGASIIIPLIFGKEYIDAIPMFTVLLIGFVFYGGLQCPAMNVLYTQRKVKSILVLTIVGAILNTVFNVSLINKVGAIGAAWGTTSVHTIIGIIANIYLHYVLRKDHSKECEEKSK